MVRCAFEETSVAELAGEAAVFGYGASANQNACGAPFDRFAFIGIVIDIHVVGAGGNFTAIFGIPDYDIGIGADADGAFAWEEAEDFGGFGAGAVNEAMDVELPGANALCP